MIVDTVRNTQFSEIMNHIAIALDIPEKLYQDAKNKYNALGEWLKRDHIEKYKCDAEIYPQGSIRIGTSVLPIKEDDDYDVDLVYRRDIKKESISQETLKEETGGQLQRYIKHLQNQNNDEEIPALKERNRCWTLKYKKAGFHLDVLPSLPDDEADKYNLRDLVDAIIITDKELREWHHTNPRGYANWFDELQKKILLEKRRIIAKKANVDIEKVPSERVPTPLRRIVQILKRHRDIKYQGNSEDKPISIIITTLAAKVYQEEIDFGSALVSIAPRMQNGIEKRDGVYWVENPINPKENFADKWQTNPERADQFFKWLRQVETDLNTASQQKGLQEVTKSLSSALGENAVLRGIQEYGNSIDDKQQQGNLSMASKTGLLGSSGRLVKKNTWYGE
jgi:hypothetical protein